MLMIMPLFLGKIGAPELVVIAIIFLVLFGGKKIPELMRGVGRGVKEFKDAVNKDYTEEKSTEAPKEEVKAEPEAKKE